MEYVSVTDAARHLGISEHAVRQRAYRSSLPSRREKNHLLIGIAHGQDAEISHETSRKTRGEIPSADPLGTTIAILQAQLTEKDKQIAELHVMLQTAQRLIPASVPTPVESSQSRDEHESHVAHEETPQEGAQRAEQASWRMRLRRWMGWG